MKVLSKKQIFAQYKAHEIEGELTICEILDELNFPKEIRQYVDVRINGHRIFPKTWDKCRPNKEAITTIAILPAGGDSNALFSTAITIAAVYYGAAFAGAEYLALSGGQAALFTAGVTLVGSQLANAMFPPPEPPSFNGFGVSKLPSVTGQTNRPDQYGPVIKNYGRNRVYPRVVAEPFVYYVGDDQYLSAVYDFGSGENEVEIAQLRIGDSSLSDFTGFSYNFADHPDDFTIYKNRTSLESFSIPFNDPGDNVIRTSPEDSHSIELSFEFPIGLLGIVGRKRRNKFIQNKISVKVRPTGTTQWTDFTNYDFDVSANAKTGTFTDQKIRLKTQWVAETTYTRRNSNGQFVTTITSYRVSHDSYDIVYKIGNIDEVSQKLRVGDTVDLLGTSNGTRGLRQAKVVEVLPDIDGSTFSARLDTRMKFSTVVSSDDPNLTASGNFRSYEIRARSNTQDYVIRNRTSSPFRSTLTINFGITDQWDVWVYFEDSIIEGLGSSPEIRNSFVWNNIIGYSNAKPVVTDIKHTYLELKIKATDQLNGRLDNLSAEIVSILWYYDDVNNVWKQKATNNPAWVFVDILTGELNQRAVSRDSLDIDSIVAWAKYCEENTIVYQTNVIGFECNFVLDFTTTVKKLLEQVCSTGRATLNVVNGKYGVAIDEYKETPTQMFNQRNILSFTSERTYAPVPGGVKCTYIDPLSGWQKNEVIAYDDGFDSSSAEVIEEIDIFACTNIAQAWRQGRYFLAKQKLRQDTVTISVDFESLACSRGDKVLFSHDVMKNGGEPGRIKSISGNNVTVDIAVADLGGSEILRIRKRSMDIIEDSNVVSFVGVHEIELDDVTGIQVDDLFVFGQQSTTTEEFIVKSIQSQDDLSATLTLIEYNEDIYTADSDVIPDYETNTVVSPLQDGSYPSAVQNLALSYSVDCHESEKRYIYNLGIEWDAPASGQADVYEIYLEVSGSQELIGVSKTRTFNYEVSGLLLDEVHKIKVVAVDGFGKKMVLLAAATESFTPYDDIIPPGSITDLNANVLTETIALDWTLLDDCDVDRYYVRFSPKKIGASWAQSVAVNSAASTQNVIQVPLRTGTYFVKARDWSGNYSNDAGFVITQIPEILNIDFISEINAPTWEGTFDNTQEFASSLTLRSIDNFDNFVADEGEFVFQEVFDLGDIYTARFQSNIIASGFTKSSLLVNWPTMASIDPIAGAFTDDDWDVASYVRSRNQLDVISDWAKLSDVDYMSFGTEATASAWQKFTNADFTGRIFQLKLELLGDIGISPIVDDVNIIANWTDRIEQERDELSGNVVTFTNAFVTLPALQVTSQENVVQGDYFLITDKTVAGFKVQFYDKDDNAVYDRKYDWIAKGFGKNYTLEELNF